MSSARDFERRVGAANWVNGRALRGLVSAVAVALLAGCASPPQLGRTHPITWADAWISGMRPVNVNEVKYLPRPKVEVLKGVRMLSMFSKPGGPYAESRWTEAFRLACIQQSGEFDGKFCRDGRNADRVLFSLALKSWAYNGSSSTEIMLFEPTEQTTTAEYQLFLHQAGFETIEMRQQRRAAAKARAEVDEQRTAVAWTQMRERGRTVCMDRDGVRYMGFVEDFTDARMKVSITRAFFRSSPGWSPSGFRPEVIWTGPSGWNLCD